MKNRGRYARHIEIIGGADGPTTIFWAGKSAKKRTDKLKVVSVFTGILGVACMVWIFLLGKCFLGKVNY